MNVIDLLIKAMERVMEPRFYSTERGYQGQLASQLDRLLGNQPPDLTRPIVEEEYQKRADSHGIKLRPDILIHIPFERGVSPTRKNDNYMVVLLKLKADAKKANADFTQLETICSALNYPIGVFVNISSAELWLPKFRGIINGNFVLHEFAVSMPEKQVQIKSAFRKAGT